MPRFRQIAVLILAALWLPATLHCDLEAAGLEELFVCTAEHHSATAEETCVDTCNAIENGWVKRASTDLAVDVPEFFACLLCVACPLPDRPHLSPDERFSAHVAAPPEIARTWQFTSRAAPPPRAPSFAS